MKQQYLFRRSRASNSGEVLISLSTMLQCHDHIFYNSTITGADTCKEHSKELIFKGVLQFGVVTDYPGSIGGCGPNKRIAVQKGMSVISEL
ncbi:hypothetical protein HAX54_021691 [Datura stramonium]|uniref:Uncharacterized protein n=1 Tax=Datura stramonium TaxID=4076 RepID=A0ABS8UVG3_DATST|nr:hypothetical protein [Datura stramonium]